MSGANLRKGQSPFYGSDTIALVDLNYTLVENSPKWGAPKIYPFIRQIEQETYRQWLVDFLRDKYAILITARPQKYREATLERIKLLTDWQPQEVYFAEISATPPEIKEDLLLRYIFPKHGRNGEDYFGIESNPKTRAMYLCYNIESLRAEDFKTKIICR
ncbi:MAG: hypothetical protein BHW65_01745 [Verrucomicrobia bacterium CAG:312_58_20]|nr:MAG: hypothetical protein BHW65_01745 [Verrucomicrobia bacterium CAG:312_58_20]